MFFLAKSEKLCVNPEASFMTMKSLFKPNGPIFLPLEQAFPQGTYISCAWNLSEAASKVHELFTAIRINSNCSANAIRISTANFVDAVPEFAPILQSHPLWTLVHSVVFKQAYSASIG